MPRPQSTVPWLNRRGDVYYVNWYEPPAEGGQGRTRARSLGTTDVVDAKARFAAFLANPTGLSTKTPGAVAAALSAVQALEDYEREHVPSCADPTRQRNAIVHLKAFFKDRTLYAVDVQACRDYAAARRSGEIGGGKRHFGERAKGSDSTIRRELHVLAAAAAHALKWKRVKANEMPSIEKPAEAPPSELRWLTRPEVDKLLEAADGALRDFIALAYFTAARRASIETLHVAQVALESGRITLRKAGERTTTKRRPIVPVHSRLKPTLERLVAGAGTHKGYLFPQPVDFYRPFHKLCEAQGIGPERANPHVLRHSRATHLLMHGVSIYDVERLLGDSVATVERVYGHHCPDHLAAVIDDES